ncbi:hypothetical protein INT45_000094 [Circinella minor]|uniref:DH domain-containing protein n=1 Tax=Circinella minor TaxID=1195481 RepID=A0A8H7SAI2_9FUNG|nr:hypothetical protein INT45_000094 [Circinella minor]
MDDDLVSEQHEEEEEEEAEAEERTSGENIITDDSAVGEDIGPSHTGSTTTTNAPTPSTISCLVEEQQQQSQSFGLLRRFSKFGSFSDNTSNTPTPSSNAPRRATSLLVSTITTTTTNNTNNNNSTFLFFNTQQQRKPTTIKFDNDEIDNSSTRPVLSRSMSLSNYYRRRFSSLIIHTNTNNSSSNEFGNSMTRARSVFIRSKQDRAVAIWRRSVAQLDLSSAGVISSSLSNSYSPEPISLKYMEPMITAMKNKDPLLIKKSGDIPILFGHLPQLLKVSQELIHLLEQRIPVEHVFIALQEELTVFLRYAVHYKTYFKTIRKACQTNVLLLSIERECLARRDTNRMGIADYLIAPIQRVPRYCLLIQDLLKHTQSTDPSHNELYIAFKMMTTLASVMNINNV